MRPRRAGVSVWFCSILFCTQANAQPVSEAVALLYEVRGLPDSISLTDRIAVWEGISHGYDEMLECVQGHAGASPLVADVRYRTTGDVVVDVSRSSGTSDLDQCLLPLLRGATGDEVDADHQVEVLVGPRPAPTPTPGVDRPDGIEDWTLHNGMRVVVDPYADDRGGYLVVGVGAVHDPVTRPGVAHVLAHLVARRTRQSTDPETPFFPGWAPHDALWFGFEYTVYGFHPHSSHGRWFRLLTGLTGFTEEELRRAVEEVNAEREATAEEWRQYVQSLHDDTAWASVELLPSARALDAVRLDDVHRLYRERYRPDNVALLVLPSTNRHRLREQISSGVGIAVAPQATLPSTRERAATHRGGRVAVVRQPYVQARVELVLEIDASTRTTRQRQGVHQLAAQVVVEALREDGMEAVVMTDWLDGHVQRLRITVSDREPDPTSIVTTVTRLHEAVRDVTGGRVPAYRLQRSVARAGEERTRCWGDRSDLWSRVMRGDAACGGAGGPMSRFTEAELRELRPVHLRRTLCKAQPVGGPDTLVVGPASLPARLVDDVRAATRAVWSAGPRCSPRAREP